MPRNRTIYSSDALEALLSERAPGPRDATGAITRICERYAELCERTATELKLPICQWQELGRIYAELPAGVTLYQARILLGLKTLAETCAVLDVLERLQAAGLKVAKGSVSELGVSLLD